MAKKPDREEVMLDLVQRYDKARLIAKEAKNEADELNSEIKAILADKEELPLPGWTVTYRYDKDKEIEAFDEETFQRKEPKKYNVFLKAKEEIEKLMKKYIKVSIQKGARSLIVERKED